MIKVRKRWLAVLGIPVIAAGAVAGIACANMPRAEFDNDAFAGSESVVAPGTANPAGDSREQDGD